MEEISYNVYPIISSFRKDECDVNKISLEHKNSNYDEKQNFYAKYNVTYDYDKIGTNQLCLLTQFLKICKSPEFYGPNAKKISFTFAINNLKKVLMDILEKVTKELQLLYPTLLKNNVILSNFIDSENILKVELNNFTNKKNKEIKSITPIYFHKSKSKGGNTIVIKNDNLLLTIKKIYSEMVLFKNKNYGSIKIDKMHKDIHYDGKLILNFNVSVIENKETCEIRGYVKVIAKEMEIRHNVSNIKSVLDEDLRYITEIKNCGVTTLTI
jgi:hypothetical protein